MNMLMNMHMGVWVECICWQKKKKKIPDMTWFSISCVISIFYNFHGDSIFTQKIASGMTKYNGNQWIGSTRDDFGPPLIHMKTPSLLGRYSGGPHCGWMFSLDMLLSGHIYLQWMGVTRKLSLEWGNIPIWNVQCPHVSLWSSNSTVWIRSFSSMEKMEYCAGTPIPI